MNNYRKLYLPLFCLFLIMISLNAYALSANYDAFNTCKKAESGAERGIADAQFIYGLMLANGHCSTFGIKKPSNAASWWQKAATLGNPDAQFSLGVSYLKGQGVSKDIYVAYKLINQAAQNGSLEAHNFLEICTKTPNNPICR